MSKSKIIVPKNMLISEEARIAAVLDLSDTNSELNIQKILYSWRLYFHWGDDIQQKRRPGRTGQLPTRDPHRPGRAQ